MKKIMIIGSCGAGKSTLALKLQQITGLELIHLDQYYWKAGWVESDKTVWQTQVEKLAQKPSWIIDGNYGGTMDIRLAAADTIIYLDRSRWVSLYRVLKRIVQYYGKTRPDLAEGCHERFNWPFIHYVFTFNDRKKPKLLRRLKDLKPHQQLFILRSNRAVKSFLKTMVLQQTSLPKK
ncbi:hypothetical protein BKI52_21265 [marine bacterium AO1-C]|nr:hypothetical protein BKI52_21265 [marine bacterium AO1-C]